MSLGIVEDKNARLRADMQRIARDAVREKVLEDKKATEGLSKLEKLELSRIKMTRLLHTDVYHSHTSIVSDNNPVDQKTIEAMANAMAGIALVVAAGVIKSATDAIFPVVKKHPRIDNAKVKILSNMAEKEPLLKKNIVFGAMYALEETMLETKGMKEEDAKNIYLDTMKSLTEEIKKQPVKYSEALKEVMEVQKKSTNLSKAEKTILKDELGIFTLALIGACALDKADKKI